MSTLTQLVESRGDISVLRDGVVEIGEVLQDRVNGAVADASLARVVGNIDEEYKALVEAVHALGVPVAELTAKVRA